MSAPLILDIYIVGVRTVQKMHRFSQVAFGSFNQQVIMIRHQNIAMKKNTMFLLCVAQILLELLIICSGKEDLLSFVTP